MPGEYSTPERILQLKFWPMLRISENVSRSLSSETVIEAKATWLRLCVKQVHNKE
jgi:hypothetical protein